MRRVFISRGRTGGGDGGCVQSGTIGSGRASVDEIVGMASEEWVEYGVVI